MEGPATFWAVVDEDVFQRGYLHVLIDLGNLDAATPGVEIAGDILLVSVDGNAVEKRVELVSQRLLWRVDIASEQLDDNLFVTVFATTPVTCSEAPELVA